MGEKTIRATIHQTSPVPKEQKRFCECGQLVDTSFADRWRCQNQADLDKYPLTLTKKSHERKKHSI